MNPKAIIAAVVLVGCGIGVTYLLGRPQPETMPGSIEKIVGNPDEYGIPADEDAPFPKAVVGETEYKFGKMLLGTTKTYAFEIKNRGEDVLKLKKGPATCKCTLSDLPKDQILELDPGKSMKVTLEWTPKGTDEAFSQSAAVWTNDPERREISFRVSGAVKNDVEFSPAEAINAGPVVENEGADAVLAITTSYYEHLPKPTVSIDSDQVEATVSSLSNDDSAIALDFLDPAGETSQVGYRITFHVKPTVPVGRFRTIATVKMNSHEVHLERKVTIEAHRSGPIELIAQPGTVLYTGANLIDMGAFSSADGKRAELVLMIKRPDDGSPVEITDVLPSVSLIKASATPDEMLNKQIGNKKSVFRVSVEIPPGTVPLDFSRRDAARILLKTTSPVVPEIELRLEAHSS